MLIVGIDPGLTRCGYAIIEPTRRGRARALAVGVVKTPKEAPIHRRLSLLRTDILELLTEYKPVAVAIERVFFYKNLNTAIGVVQAAGVVAETACTFGSDVSDYSPSDVKLSICGDGNADKAAVSEMVAHLLNLKAPPKPADAADACAMALCHLAYNPKGLSGGAAPLIGEPTNLIRTKEVAK